MAPANWPPKVGVPLPRAAEAWCERVKLDEWVLAEQGHGKEWERVFRVGPGDWERVWEAIGEAVVDASIETVRDRAPFGVACGVEVRLTLNGRTAPVTISWHYENEDAAPRLVTAYLTL